MIDNIVQKYQDVARSILSNKCDDDLITVVAIIMYLDDCIVSGGDISFDLQSINNAPEVIRILDYLCSPIGRPRVYKLGQLNIFMSNNRTFESVFGLVLKYPLL